VSTSIGFDIFARDRGASATLDKVGRHAEDSGGRFSKMKALAVGSGALAGAAIVKFGKDSVAAYTEAQESGAALEDAFKRFPRLADTNIGALQALNSQLELKTKYDDDATASAQSVLAGFKLTGKQITDLTPLLQDYASKTGKDLPTAARDLGKALLGQGRSLKDVGINFTDTKSLAGNFDEIMGGLRTQVGGFAENEGKTAAGQSAILQNEFGELQETVGSKLLPALLKVAGAGIKVTTWVTNNSKVVKIGLGVVGGFTAAVYALIVAQRIQAFVSKQAAEETLLFSTYTKLAAAGSKIWAAGQWLINAALSANPIGLVIVAVAALVGGIILAYKHSATFRAIVQAAFQGISAAASFMWNNVLKPTFKFLTSAFLAVAGAIIHGAALAFGWVPGIGPKLRSAAAKFDTFKDQVNRALANTRSYKSVRVTTPGADAAIHKLAQLRYQQDHIDPAVTIRAYVTANKAGFRAAGGPVEAGKSYIVGEHRPELFVPDQDGMILPSVPGRAGGHTAYAATSGDAAADGQPLVVQLAVDGRVLHQALLKVKRQNGGVGLELG